MNHTKDAIIALSGGLDSATLMYRYQERIALAVSFDYGSVHNQREISYASKLCNTLGIEHIVIALDFLPKYFTSGLLLGQENIRQGEYSEENMATTIVPFRNGIMISILAGIAESRKLGFVLLANHFGDHAIYPDCTEAFATSMNRAVQSGTTNNVELLTPFTLMTKTEIVKEGDKIGVPFGNTYSCYLGKEKHCGKCGTCLERKKAFEEAGVVDPTLYMSEE